MEKFTEDTQSRKLDKLYLDTKHWKSMLHFTADEILFIGRLLNSYVFEPNTPNLFERLGNYQDQLKKIIADKNEVAIRIRKHEAGLGGMLECMDNECDLTYYRKHEQLKSRVAAFLEEFRQLKSDVFNYAGGILKKKKP